MEQLNQEPVTDMTAAEYFNGEGSPLTLDKILQPQERDFLLEHIELYAQGKVNQFKASQSHPAPEPNEVGEVYVWVKASEQNPSPEKKEHFICLIEKRGNGKVEVKPAYGYWCYSTWRVEDGWKVIEWLSIHQSHPAPVGGEQEFIVCSAIQYFRHPGHEIIVAGLRHNNCISTYFELTGDQTHDEEQGFLTSKNRFVNRIEAGQIALACGQIKELKYYGGKMLDSSDLYHNTPTPPTT